MAMTSKELWKKLIAYGKLDGIDLPTSGGRYDLRGVNVEAPTALSRDDLPMRGVVELAGLTTIRGAHWKGLDLSDSYLPDLRIFDSVIEDCRFDGARCPRWRIWNTTIRNTSFRESDLSGSSLGAADQRKRRNLYSAVEFDRTDLRKTSHLSSSMRDCKFTRAQLETINFEGTGFVRCVFEGPLRDVVFNRYGVLGETYEQNEMRNVDLSRATLRFVQFRGLDMEHVSWPNGGHHLVVTDYRSVLERLIHHFRSRPDPASQRGAEWLSIERKWMGPKQHTGIVNLADLREVSDEPTVTEILRLLRPD